MNDIHEGRSAHPITYQPHMVAAGFGNPDPFSDEALGQRTPEAIAQDDRQEVDLRSIQAAEQTVCGCWERPAARQGVYCGGNECLMLVPPTREQFDSTYLAALVVIANEEGAGRYARAINLVARIWGKTEREVLVDAVSL